MRRPTVTLLWLLCGLLAYWSFRPNVIFLDILGLGAHEPLHVAWLWGSFLKNHLADVAWCAAAFTMALHLRERHSPAIYPSLLTVLPFASELAPALGVLPGTFDGIDLILYAGLWLFYFRKEIGQMRPVRQHLVGSMIVAFFALALIGSGSAPRVKYESGVFQLPPQPQDEIWVKPVLTEILKRSTNTAVVLRVPASSEKITEEQAQKNSVIYSTIEKELAKAGFMVRDRQLFSKVLDQGALDYSRIGVLTETDVILELVRFAEKPYFTDQYKSESGKTESTPRGMSFTGALIEFKLTGVKENDIVGTFIFHYAPCTDSCTRRFSPTLSASADLPLNVDTVSKEFAQRLVEQLKKYK